MTCTAKVHVSEQLQEKAQSAAAVAVPGHSRMVTDSVPIPSQYFYYRAYTLSNNWPTGDHSWPGGCRFLQPNAISNVYHLRRRTHDRQLPTLNSHLCIKKLRYTSAV